MYRVNLLFKIKVLLIRMRYFILFMRKMNKKTLLLNSLPWSDRMRCGAPYIKYILAMHLATSNADLDSIGYATTYFET